MNLIARLFGRHAAATIAYEESKRQARDPDSEIRRVLAGRADVRPEILYYLAADDAPQVRRAIAANAGTPGQADLVLSRDGDDEVRCELARKIGRLLPGLSAEQTSKIRDLALETLEILARDQLPRVRAILAEELKHADTVPREIVGRLARDVETIVAAPVLEYSPLLSDGDLLEIISAGTSDGALAAIARRNRIGTSVTDAIAGTMVAPAVAALLANESAQIREETLDLIIDSAPENEAWHQPLVLRPELTVRAMRRIAGFVAAALVDLLAEKHKLDDGTAADLRKVVRRRIDAVSAAESAIESPERVRDLKAAGKLDDETVADAIDRNDRAFVLQALAELSGLPTTTIARVVDSKSPKGVTAIAWKAGLSMRTAVRLQHRVALIPPKQVLNARNGVDYPLNASDLEMQLSLVAG